MTTVRVGIIVIALGIIAIFMVPTPNTPHWVDVLLAAFWGGVIGCNFAGALGQKK